MALGGTKSAQAGEPFIVTLILDPSSQALFDRLRAEHFPPARLFVGAHVTLFHALPPDLDAAAELTARTTGCARFPVQVTGLRFLGRGVAFRLESERLRQIRNQYRSLWLDRLTPQDRAPWQPHVTIQNKVEPAVARALHDRMSAVFSCFEVQATGLALWTYRNGPWEAVGRFPFGDPQAG